MEQFFQVPKSIFYLKREKDLSEYSLYIYIIMLDRLKLSKINNYKDEDGRYYIYFSYSKIMDLLGIKQRNTVSNAIKQLTELGLIEKKRTGRGSIFYVNILDEASENDKNNKNNKNNIIEHKTNNSKSDKKEKMRCMVEPYIRCMDEPYIRSVGEPYNRCMDEPYTNNNIYNNNIYINNKKNNNKLLVNNNNNKYNNIKYNNNKNNNKLKLNDKDNNNSNIILNKTNKNNFNLNLHTEDKSKFKQTNDVVVKTKTNKIILMDFNHNPKQLTKTPINNNQKEQVPKKRNSFEYNKEQVPKKRNSFEYKIKTIIGSYNIKTNSITKYTHDIERIREVVNYAREHNKQEGWIIACLRDNWVLNNKPKFESTAEKILKQFRRSR